MNVNQKEILKGIMQANKQPVRLNSWQARQFCTDATITNEVLKGMQTYMIHCDALEKFLKQNISHIYIDPLADKHCQGEATILSLHTIIVQCIIL